MEMIKKLAKKEIKFAHGIALVIVFSVIATGFVSYHAQSGSLSGTRDFGGRVIYYVPVCVEDLGECANCPLCTVRYGSACGGMSEVSFAPTGGSEFLFICPVQGYPYIGGPMPIPGHQVAGEGIEETVLMHVEVD